MGTAAPFTSSGTTNPRPDSAAAALLAINRSAAALGLAPAVKGDCRLAHDVQHASRQPRVHGHGGDLLAELRQSSSGATALHLQGLQTV